MTTTTQPKPTVKRDGTVILDGKVIGTIERTTQDTSVYSAVFGTEGPVRFIPRLPDGEPLAQPQDTRRRAVAILVRARITSVDDFKVERAWGGDLPFVSATVRYKGHTMGISRYAHERGWVVDFYAAPGSICPVWSNGAGSRCTRAHVLDKQLAELADDAFIAWVATLPDAPL